MKLFGSALILSGTALGAGMLAIPMLLAQFGLVASSVLMLLIFIGTTYSGLLLTEVCAKVPNNNGMSSVALHTLGKSGQLIINLLFYALLVCIMMAYIQGVGDILHKLLASFGWSISVQHSYIAFTLITGLVVAAGTLFVDKLNRVLFIIMALMLAVTIAALLSDMSIAKLLSTSDLNPLDMFENSSVIFTSFTSMVVIPSLVIYNQEATKKELRNMILLGSLIPLICYLAWLYAIIGNLGAAQVGKFSAVTELIAAFSDENSYLKVIISIFSGLALVTSFLGVSMALFDLNRDALTKNKSYAYLLTFVLPLLLTGLFADKFISLLNYAGIILVFLAILGPLAMVIQVRKSPDLSADNGQVYTAEGGQIALVFTFAFAVFILASQFV